jgi:hypothetical protein
MACLNFKYFIKHDDFKCKFLNIHILKLVEKMVVNARFENACKYKVFLSLQETLHPQEQSKNK